MCIRDRCRTAAQVAGGPGDPGAHMVGLDPIQRGDLPAAEARCLELQRLDAEAHHAGGLRAGLMKRPKQVLLPELFQNGVLGLTSRRTSILRFCEKRQRRILPAERPAIAQQAVSDNRARIRAKTREMCIRDRLDRVDAASVGREPLQGSTLV